MPLKFSQFSISYVDTPGYLWALSHIFINNAINKGIIIIKKDTILSLAVIITMLEIIKFGLITALDDSKPTLHSSLL